MKKFKLVDFYREPHTEITEQEAKKTGLKLYADVFLREFWGLILLNFVTVLFFLPIVTIPAAISASSRVVTYMLEDKNVYIWKDFIRIFKRDFLESLGAGIIFGGIIFAIIALFYNLTTEENQIIMQVIQAVLLFFAITIGGYTFTSIPLLDIPLSKAIKNSLILTLFRLPYNAVASLITMALVLLSVTFFPLSLIWVGLFALSFINLTMTFCTYSGIEKYIINKDKILEKLNE